MKGLFIEKMEYLNARYKTKEGLFEWLIGTFAWGFILVNYTDNIYNFLYELLPVSIGILRVYITYLGFGIVLLPLGIAVTYILTKFFKLLKLKNGKVL